MNVAGWTIMVSIIGNSMSILSNSQIDVELFAIL